MNLDSFRVIQERIPAHSGQALVMIFVAFDALTKPHAREAESLRLGAAQAVLALETRRLYSVPPSSTCLPTSTTDSR
jgi:hypothetical protein